MALPLRKIVVTLKTKETYEAKTLKLSGAFAIIEEPDGTEHIFPADVILRVTRLRAPEPGK